ncbi:MAG: DUF5060 domain-containing protein [Candidatus Hydrogenedentes bacterium]|nr:DUF5060 domain-containing protein [Candidatus Hydrogenedentota bacterium]
MIFSAARYLFLVGIVCFGCSAAGADKVYPGKEWAHRDPSEMSIDAIALDRVAEDLGGRGCMIKDGHVIKTWGDQSEVGDWASSAKPVLSTLLFFAIEEGLVKNVDQPIADFGWPLSDKDKSMTFRHLGAMTGGYARPEAPGAAWAYNDFAIQLYQKTLFEKVFKLDAKSVADDPKRLGPLQFEDGLKWSEKARLAASPRDFARIAWLWLNKGRWGDKQLLPARYFNEYCKPQVPSDIALSDANIDTNDYLQIGSYGGGSNHFSDSGPGTYGFNWWFNVPGGKHPNVRMWPDAPEDTFMSLGVRGNSSAIIPSLNAVLVCAEGSWQDDTPGDRASKKNQILGRFARAAGYKPTNSAEHAKWQPYTISVKGPASSESATPNPFTDYRMTVTFTNGDKTHVVPGFFAADGDAAESSADAGDVWRAHFMPDAEGEWTYTVSFRQGANIAISDDPNAGEAVAPDGETDKFSIGPVDPLAPGFYSEGMLQYVGKRYLRFAESKRWYLKGGADSPENFLAFADFDQTKATHHYEPHAKDFRNGDPTWQNGKGKNILGALNYLASEKMNVVYFLTMNVKGDGKDVWPWTSQDERFRFDCSKLDQWEIVFRHMDRLGLLMHVVLQEQENDQLLDSGELGPERKLYHRELVARFAHHPAIVWNLGEENTNTNEQRKAFAAHMRALDTYHHPIVIHTFPSKRDEVYEAMVGDPNIDGPSLQLGHMEETYGETKKWIAASRDKGKQWFVCNDEIGPAREGVVPDSIDPEHNGVRKHALWGNLMAGGSGAEWLFGVGNPHDDIDCEDWRSRDVMWDQTRYALEFFKRLPFSQMEIADDVVSGGEAWCLAKPGEAYAIYAYPATNLSVTLPEGQYRVRWYNPRAGGEPGNAIEIKGGSPQALGNPPADADKDWAIIIKPSAK